MLQGIPRYPAPSPDGMPSLDHKRRAALLAASALVPALVAGCGGGGGGKDATALLDKAFKGTVRSADVNLSAQLRIAGVKGLDKPVRIKAVGPYVSSRTGIPRLDIDLTLGAPDSGQSIQTGFLSTGDRAFVKFGGAFYEQPRSSVTRANRNLAKGSGGRPVSLRDLGLSPRDWVRDARSRGTETVGGVKVERVSGKVDVRTAVRDLNRVVQRSAGRVPNAPRPLTAKDLDALAKVVKNPSFDVYVGKRDDLIRRVSLSLDLAVPKADRARLGGISGGSIRFSLELDKVNGSQTVQAPATSRPISDLTKQLGGLAALRAGAGAATPGSGSGGSSGSAQGGSSSSSLQRYSDCIDRAKPSDTAALTRCSQLVR